jgi:hypothetical protein
MKHIKKMTFVLLLMVSFMVTKPAYGDLFGGDTVVLTQILANAIKQLIEMQRLVQSGQDSLNLMRDINRGINDSLRVIDSIGPYIDPGLYHDLRRTAEIVGHLKNVYGIIAESPERQVQQDTDSVVAESLNMNNKLYDYSKELDTLAENIKAYSHNVSPGGAAKLTAQSLGVMVHVMSRQIQAQGQAMKIQAQALAIQNKREKDDTRAYLDQSGTLKAAMKTKNVTFEFPRF